MDKIRIQKFKLYFGEYNQTSVYVRITCLEALVYISSFKLVFMTFTQVGALDSNFLG